MKGASESGEWRGHLLSKFVFHYRHYCGRKVFKNATQIINKL